MANLMGFSAIASDDLPKPDFSCLTRDEKELIQNQFMENSSCHKALSSMVIPDAKPDDWSFFFGAFILGAIAGVVGAAQARK